MKSKTVLPAEYIKGYILFKKGYVTVKSGGFVEVKSESHLNERPYVMRVLGDLSYEHSCGATAKKPDVLCKHMIAYQFQVYNSMVIPNDEVVDAFEYYRKNFSSKAFNRDMRLYSMDYLAFPELADSLWLCIFSRLMIQNQPRINKSPLESEYEDLISNEKYLTAKLKSLKEDQDNVIKRVSSKFDGKNLNDIITECELEGITNTKEIIHRAFEEGLILPKRLGKAYMRAYRHRSDLNLVF